jgi:hypothetical protein
MPIPALVLVPAPVSIPVPGRDLTRPCWSWCGESPGGLGCAAGEGGRGPHVEGRQAVVVRRWPSWS